ncbi:MAG: ABC transporter ATP-binding protein [Ornithinimicrobium sp.]
MPTSTPPSSTPSPVDPSHLAVEFDGVSRSFGSIPALDGVSWGAAAGEVTCVLGPNGAGKSTSMEIATGLQQPDSGSVRVLQTDPWHAEAEHRARVGVMLQDGGLPQAARPLALITHLSRMYADPWEVGDLCHLLGIDEFGTTSVRRLSGGQRRRLALAAALVGRPEVLFLDEPTAGLDPHARRVTHRVVREAADAGAAVVLSTHAFEEAERLADRVVIVAHGRVVADGSVEDIRDGVSLEDRYFALTDEDAR